MRAALEEDALDSAVEFYADAQPLLTKYGSKPALKLVAAEAEAAAREAGAVLKRRLAERRDDAERAVLLLRMLGEGDESLQVGFGRAGGFGWGGCHDLPAHASCMIWITPTTKPQLQTKTGKVPTGPPRAHEANPIRGLRRRRRPRRGGRRRPRRGAPGLHGPPRRHRPGRHGGARGVGVWGGRERRGGGGRVCEAAG
jgi:hypothetical protein